jgi:endo-1,4-beta-mannosidase
MEYFEDYGDKLYLMNQFVPINNKMPKDFTKIHIHPHYEMLAALDLCNTVTIINGNKIKTDYPFIAFVAPYNMHLSYYYAFENAPPSRINNRLAYFGDGFTGLYGSDVMPLKN